MNMLKKLAAVVLSAALIVSCMFIGYATAEENTQLRYYCGFEDYTEQISGISLDCNVASIDTDTVYVGEKALKLTLADNGITAFELRDSVPFDIVSGKEYTVSFVYKTSANVEISVGLAKAGNVTKTAEAQVTVEGIASDEWQTAYVTVTPDKSTNDGYALAMLVFTDVNAEIYFDDIKITYYSKGASTLDEIDSGYNGAWFPKQLVFSDGTGEHTQPIEIWNGEVAESFAGGTGTEEAPYQISNGSELALAITKGGTDETYYNCYFKLTKDIYLNELDKINWNTGVAQNSYKINSWYKYSENFAGTIDGDGHTHAQNWLYSEDVDLWQINSASAQVRDGFFDIMTVSDNVINRYNIGRGYDQSFIQTQSAEWGDVNQDKSADICDLVKLNLIVSGNESKTAAADVDRNSKLEIILDSVALRKLLIGAK